MAKEKLNIDSLIQKLAGFGVPALIFITAYGASGFFGAAAITTALAAIGGPVGMIGGITILIASGPVAELITKYGVEFITVGVIKELYKRGETKESLLEKVERSKTSENLKKKLKETIECL